MLRTNYKIWKKQTFQCGRFFTICCGLLGIYELFNAALSALSKNLSNWSTKRTFWKLLTCNFCSFFLKYLSHQKFLVNLFNFNLSFHKFDVFNSHFTNFGFTRFWGQTRNHVFQCINSWNYEKKMSYFYYRISLEYFRCPQFNQVRKSKSWLRNTWMAPYKKHIFFMQE